MDIKLSFFELIEVPNGKSKEELTAIKAETEAVAKKLQPLTPEELEFVVGGFKMDPNEEESTFRTIVDWLNKIVH